MYNNINLNKILFVDIETVPATSTFDELSEEMKELWKLKANRISREENPDPGELFFEKAGIFSEFGKIVCISAGFFYRKDKQTRFRTKAFANHNEKILLKDFAKLLQLKFNTAANYLCGHNSKEFDFPYIARRMLVNQIPLPSILNTPGRKPWEVTHLDTLELWKFGDYKHYTSLNLLCTLFGIPTPKDDIKGSDVAKVYYQENNLERIAAYCNKDVVSTARLFLKFSLKGELTDEHIESIVDIEKDQKKTHPPEAPDTND